MKKATLIIASVLCIFAAASCGQNNNKKKAAQAAEVKTEAQLQAEAVVKAQLDSIANVLGQINPIGVVGSVKEGRIVLSSQEKQVKPEYLADPAIAENAQTLDQKYRAAAVISVDSEIAKLYEMPTEAYEAAMKKLYADLNDPALKSFSENVELKESINTFYNSAKENGRETFFWSAVSSAIVEQTYIASCNTEKFIVAFDDKAVTDFTWDIVLLTLAVEDLAKVNADYAALDASIAPLKKIDAINVEQFKSQLETLREEISASRAELLK